MKYRINIKNIELEVEAIDDPTTPDPVEPDPVIPKPDPVDPPADFPAMKHLLDFERWYGRDDYIIAETGVPTNDLADKYFDEAEAFYSHASAFAAWAAGDWWGDYQLRIKDNEPTSDLYRELAQSKLVGVSLAGAEFNEQNNPGKENTNYTLHDGSGAWQQLKDDGFDFIRYPFLAERYKQQPDKYHRLWKDSPLPVMPDLHEYARGWTKEALLSFWLDVLKRGHENFMGIEIMNEPEAISPKEWEEMSEYVVKGIIDAGYDIPIYVDLGRWSSMQDVWEMHPNGWWLNGYSNVYPAPHYYWPPNHNDQYN